MANTESVRTKINVTIADPASNPPGGGYGESVRSKLNVTIAPYDPANVKAESVRSKINVTIVSPKAVNSTEGPRSTVNVTINKRIAVLFWTVKNGVRVPLFAFDRPLPPPPPDPEEPPDPENPVIYGPSSRSTVSLRIGQEPTETRDPTLWAYAQIGPANSPRGSGAILAPLNDERTLALRGGITVNCAGVNKTLNTAMQMNISAWSVGVNIAKETDPLWTLTGDGATDVHTVRIPNPPIRSTETGNADYLTDLIQPDGTSLSIYKFGYLTYDTTNRRASMRSGAWNRVDLRKSGGISDDPAHPQYHRGPRASQAPALFGLIRKWEIEKAISGDPRDAIRHTLAVATQGPAIKRGSMNGGIAQVWPAYGHDYHGDRATQVLDPPTSGTFTLTSTVGGVTKATTQPWNVAVSTLQTAVRSWGGDYGAVAITGTAGSSYSIVSVRSNANTFRVSTGATITAPGTTYGNTGVVQGQYFIVDPATDVAGLPMIDPVAFAIGYCLQDFGGYVTDISSTMVVYSEVAAASLLTARTSQIAKDLAVLRRHFRAVTNNSETNIHGGGTPVRELAPPFIV